jgi:uncharacterized protein YndB with AHSA1/START domain
MTKPQRESSAPVAPVNYRRWFNAQRDVVFSAWTNPDHMKHWLHPGPEWSNPVIEVDLRVGGQYRLGFQHLDKPEVVFVFGRFLAIEQGKLLVYTWGWEAPDLHAGVETVVTVTFETVDAGTEVNLTHERFPDDAIRQRHSDGWQETIDCLTHYLESM